MAKLGWIVAGLMGITVCGIAAARPADESAKLEEIRALLVENNRVQRMDVHARLQRKHPLFKACDLDAKCQTYEAIGAYHATEYGLDPEYHFMTEECVNVAACRKVEEAVKEKRKQKQQK